MKKTLPKIVFTALLLGLAIPTLSHAEENKQEIPWGIQKIEADVSHMQNLTGKGVKIAVIDSGINEHEDLNVAEALNFHLFNGGGLPNDDWGHGTHVTGIIAAKDDEKGIVGVAPDAEIYALKVLGPNGGGIPGDVGQALDWCLDNNIDVVNMSFEMHIPSDMLNGLNQKLEKLREKGVLLVSAAGNGGKDSLPFPADSKHVISVGSIDKDGQLASNSNYGEQLDVVAPGVGVCSSFSWKSNLVGDASLCDRASGDNYGKLSGTSMAAPHVTGVLALLKEKYPNATADELETKLFDTTRDLGDRNKFGYGLVQAPTREKEEYENLEIITNTEMFRPILETEVYQYRNLFDKNKYSSTTFYKNGKLKYRFENGTQPLGFNVTYENGIEEQNLVISFYDLQQNLLKKVPIKKAGTYLFDKLESDVYYFQIENTESTSMKIAELEILGNRLKYPKKVFNLNSSITVKYDNKILYEDVQTLENGIRKEGLLNKTLTVTKGSEWNDDYQQYSKVMVTNEELGIKDKWIDVDLKNGEMRPIYEKDLTSTMYGQIVKDEGNYYSIYLHDDSTSYPPSLYPNKKYTYEFDVPMSVNGYYFNYIHNRLGNKLKITLTNTDGYEFPLEVNDTTLFYRHMSFSIDYENIKKFTIENVGTEEFKMYEFALLGKESENKTFPEIDIQLPVGLSWMGFKLYDYPNAPTYTTVSYLPDNKTVYSKKGYALNTAGDIFNWMQIEWDGKLKWVNFKDVNMQNLYKNGFVNSAGGKLSAEKNTSWGYYIFNDGGIPATMYPEGFVEYEFNNPVSIKEMYFSSGDYIDNSDNKLVLELLDKDKNVIYTRNISRDDLYRRIVPFEAAYDNIKFLRIINKGQYNAKISKINVK